MRRGPATDLPGMIDEDCWHYREGKRDGHEFMAATRDPLDRARWPGCDHHVALRLGYTPHWWTGLPKPSELTRLQDFEDDLIEKLVATSAGELVATETTQGRRTLHLYLRADSLMLEMFRGWAAKDPGKKGPWVSVTQDPAWAGVAHLAAPVAR